jgi:alpha-beta hydrolase superfamily lysophospholipase
MIQADEQIRMFLGEISEKRGTVNVFDRFEQDWVTSGDLRLHLDVIEADGKRPTVVFMPGTNAYAVLYGEFLAALADKGYNIVGFDPRGHGRSEGARGSYTLPELMADMRAAVRYARNRFGEPVVVSGSSQGGIAAFYLAAEGYPVAGAVCHNLADLGDPASIELTRSPGLSRRAVPA